ncbi:MAG: hypothetical protein ACREDR_40795, partial [Blastocatellia bacterium]
GMFELAREYGKTGMAAYSLLQQREFDSEAKGYRGVKHQAFVGTGYFDALAQTIAGGEISTAALRGSTEEDQFTPAAALKGSEPIGSRTGAA